MTRILTLVWYWSLLILPFTVMITFILTLVVCRQVLRNNAWSGVNLPHISVLGTGPAYNYFVSGFVILTAQFLLILIGRLQFLFHSQSIIHRAILCAIHAISLLACVFLLIMAIVSLDRNNRLHLTGAIGMFGLLSSYCSFHTIVAFYLFVRRSNAPQHSNILWPLWFLVCCIVLIICASIWGATSKSIPQYIAAAMPFLYIIGFVPQFWNQARMKSQNSGLSVQFKRKTTSCELVT
ncbi:unnamed protein product [Rotaria socialis]|uniref:CWH43-like N-terminal domain-containing protein n=1 Tax=Rotaria socialis TaxID=392032 RepID=A0A821A4I2_9BILA|nr:unnamed protein product [Rotaria socialis]CAF4568991.1 unnamed protein product [Rotaria socialis]